MPTVIKMVHIISVIFDKKLKLLKSKKGKEFENWLFPNIYISKLNTTRINKAFKSSPTSQ